MNYKVNKFNIILTRVSEELEEKEIKATKIINIKPTYYEEFNKKRYFYKLESLNYFNNNLTITYLLNKVQIFDRKIINYLKK